MDFEKELEELPFNYECIYCNTLIEVKLTDKVFKCPKCGSEFHVVVEKSDFIFNSFIGEEDGQE